LMKEIPTITTAELRKFGYALGAFIGVLFGAVLPWLKRGSGAPWPVWPWVVLAVFAAWATIAPETIRPFHQLLMRISRVINAIVSPVILGIVFFLVVLPTGIILKLRGRDPMRRQFRANSTESYRVESQRAPPEQMEKPF